MSEHHLRLVGRYNLPVRFCETYFGFVCLLCLPDAHRCFVARRADGGEQGHGRPPRSGILVKLPLGVPDRGRVAGARRVGRVAGGRHYGARSEHNGDRQRSRVGTLVSSPLALRRKLPCPYGRVVGFPRWAAGFPGNPAAVKVGGDLTNSRPGAGSSP
eukprot:4614896-Pyramimonas_sp.AAC.1